MSDEMLTLEILHQIQWSVQTIQNRFAPIESPDDFILSDEGMEKLDAICMQLIVIGESLKNLTKLPSIPCYLAIPQVEWNKVIKMRDVLSHHYFDLDAEVVYTVCTSHLKTLAQIISQMIVDLSS